MTNTPLVALQVIVYQPSSTGGHLNVALNIAVWPGSTEAQANPQVARRNLH